MEDNLNLPPPDPPVLQLPSNVFDLLVPHGYPLSYFNLAQFPFISNQIFKQYEKTPYGSAGSSSGTTLGEPSSVPLAQPVNKSLQGPILNTPKPYPTPQLPISPNSAKIPVLPSFPSLPLQFSPPWMLSKNDESSEDSGIQSRSSSMDSSMISPQNYRDYKMSRDEIEELLEQTYRENNYPKMETKKLVQSKTGMSIEAINQRFQKKRKMEQPDGTLPKKAPVPFSMDIREKLLEKYVLGEKVSLEERETLSRETGLTLKQNPELQTEDLQNMARKYRKFSENHEDEQKNGGLEGHKNGEMTDGMRTWSASRRNTYRRSLKMPNDEINKLIEAALQVRFLPTIETKEKLCKITGLSMEALTTRMSRRRRKPFPKTHFSSNGGDNSSLFHEFMGCHDQETGSSRDGSETPKDHDAEGIEGMEAANSRDSQNIQITHDSGMTPDDSSNSINVTIESPFSLFPPTIKPDEIQDFLTTAYKNNLDPSFTEIEHWASQIGKSGSWVYEWIKHYRSDNGYAGFEEDSKVREILLNHSEGLDLDRNMNKNHSYRLMELSEVLTGRNGER
ncbi:hypothetical protein CAEBREN_23784 [Caenorhabditis brenneri]|uniref:Homeobox domain-containing protein n=1 Tax=Caenorhabditis brenneri TaxID=135651 RepID=G0N6Y3_CAEBE|nr:hypothetical protein CAEBREN_23784 [Caenorhabditis brenneri]